MPSNPGQHRRTTVLAKSGSAKHRQASGKSAVRRSASKQAIEEIKASIAIRDSLLAEAEEDPTNVTLKRALMANEFVESCLKPARRPYAAQHLSEADAARERKRCAVVRRRIAALRADIAAH